MVRTSHNLREGCRSRSNVQSNCARQARTGLCERYVRNYHVVFSQLDRSNHFSIRFKPTENPLQIPKTYSPYMTPRPGSGQDWMQELPERRPPERAVTGRSSQGRESVLTSPVPVPITGAAAIPIAGSWNFSSILLSAALHLWVDFASSNLLQQD